MKKNVYLCDIDTECLDYIFTKEVIEGNSDFISSFDSADIYLFNAGVFISGHNASSVKNVLSSAIKAGKRIVIIKPYGTSYLPLYFRQLNLPSIELLKSQIENVLNDVPLDNTKILFNRYC